MIGTNASATGAPTNPGGEQPADAVTPPQQRLGKIGDVARLTNVAEKTIRRMCDAGKLPGVMRLGRLLRFDLKVINCWIDQGCPPLHRFSPTGGQ